MNDEQPRWRRYLRFWGPDVERDIDVELRFHMEMRERDYQARGLDVEAARRAASESFGDVAEVRAWLRDHDRRKLRSTQRAEYVSEVAQDARYALRQLRQQPVFAVTTILMLALAIGATTAIFSAVDTLLLRPLGFTDADALVEIHGIDVPLDDGAPKIVADIRDVRALTNAFSDVAAYAAGGMNLSTGDEARRVRVGAVTDNLFRTLGVAPMLGRGFSVEEGRSRGPRAAVISEGLWRSQFNGAQSVLGKSLILNGIAHPIVGVMPRSFRMPRDADLWVPLTVPLSYGAWEAFRHENAAQVIASALPVPPLVARLAPGITIDAATLQVRGVLGRFGTGNRAMMGPPRAEPSAPAIEPGSVLPLWSEAVSTRRTALLVLMGATALVLLVACANVANLLIARMAARRREIELRGVLGATPGRVFRQLLAESVILALLGGAFGVLLAYGSLGLIEALMPPALAGVTTLRIDERVLTFAALLVLATAMLFGLWPALDARRTSPNALLQTRSVAMSQSRSSSRLSRVLVVSEVALALVLLVSAGVMLRSFQALLRTDAGFQSQHVATLELTTAQSQFRTRAERRQLYDRILERLRTTPGIEAAAAVSDLPLRGQDRGDVIFLWPDGQRPEDIRPEHLPQELRVTEEYFAAMGIPVMRGRAPRAKATHDGEYPYYTAVESGEIAINQMMADKLWPGQDPIGKYFTQGPTLRLEVVGVVADVRHTTLESDASAQAYFALLDSPPSHVAVVVRGRGSPAQLVTMLRNAAREAAPRQAVYNVRTMDDVVSATVAPRRANTLIITAFGVVALVLAALGVYGVIAHGVARRTREIGIRLTLGAEPPALLASVFKEAISLAALGCAIGLLGAWALTQTLSGLVYGVTARDPIAFATGPIVLLGAAALAALLPALRVLALNPVQAIRTE